MKGLIAIASLGFLACSKDRPVATAETIPAIAPEVVAESESSFWGPAPPLAKRLEVFDAIANDLEAIYLFEAAELDWETTRPLLRARVESAASFSDFYRVFTDLSRGLRDSHNAFVSKRVCQTPISERPPLLRGFMKALGSPQSLGFCGTALDDDSVLVYRADEKNPASLKPGDRIVGFDGKGLRPLLQEALSTLPYCGATAGNRKSDDLLMIAAMAYNPHLYQTMDVVRHGQTKVEAIETDTIVKTDLPKLGCNEQLATAIPFPWKSAIDSMTRSPVSSGILPGTNIGYLYVYGWIGDVETAFLEALKSLQKTNGLIIDTRLNIGGNSFASYPGLRFLFKEDITDRLHIARRPEPTGKDETPKTAPRNIKVDPATHYDHPIAILTGPLAGSSADGVTYLLAAHPRARRFGRPTNGSPCFAPNGTSHSLGPKMGALLVRRTPCTTLDENKKPLSGSALEPEVSVWLTPDDAESGRDTVVQTALTWISKENATKANKE